MTVKRPRRRCLKPSSSRSQCVHSCWLQRSSTCYCRVLLGQWHAIII